MDNLHSNDIQSSIARTSEPATALARLDVYASWSCAKAWNRARSTMSLNFA
jgi:hypothetical protein